MTTTTPSTIPTTTLEPYQTALRMAEAYSRSIFAWLTDMSELLFDQRAPWNGALRAAQQVGDVGALPVRLTEQEREYKLAAELPGLNAKDIDVRVAAGAIRIAGERPERVDVEAPFAIGRYEREIPLPSSADPEKITAEYHEGLLTISVPKNGRAREHKVAVKAS